MMALDPPGSGDEKAAPATVYSGPRPAALSHKPLALRRRRSKGTIAGFAASTGGKDGAGPTGPEGVDPGGGSGGPDGSLSSSDGRGPDGEGPLHRGGSGLGDAAPGAGAGAPGGPRSSLRPSHATRLALLCAQNAARMGVRTRAALCPPGRPRMKLLKALADERRKHGKGGGARLRQGGRGSVTSSALGGGGAGKVDGAFDLERIVGEDGLARYEQAEELLMADPDSLDREVNTDGEEIGEDPSSGDEDDLDFYGILDDDYGSPNGKEKKANIPLREPLYTPVGTDPNAGGQGAGGAGGTAASGKLPFNRRKVRWFDTITAADRDTARQWLRKEMQGLKKRDLQALTSHLKRMQRREKRRIAREKGNNVAAGVTSDDEAEDEAIERNAIAAGVGSLPPNMTPSLSAALVLESLVIQPLESLDGMSKCYDAIVAAGTALLDTEGDSGRLGKGPGGENKPTKSEILAALAPVLITTLEHVSGEAIVALARLRDMCGTRRYRRRFVQRVAPSLVRPPNGAMWCLRHQQDMEAILGATEMILDSAQDLFGQGWYERGRTILADSKRAETLQTAADQLKKLSAGGDWGAGSLMGAASLGGGLSSSGKSHRRGGSGLMGSTSAKDGTGGSGSGSSEPLAEWEVLAVDLEIRASIGNLFTGNWSRIVLTNAPPRDTDSVGSSHRQRRGISSNKAKHLHHHQQQASASATLTASPQLEMDANASASSLLQQPPSPLPSPLSPRGPPHKVPLPVSPPSQPPTLESLESVFGPSFATQTNVSADAQLSPTAPGSPPSLSRKTGFGEDAASASIKSVASREALTPPHTPVPPPTGVGTPPRSPPHTTKSTIGMGTPPQPTPQVSEGFLSSVPQVPTTSPGGSSIAHSADKAPLSPMSTASTAIGDMASPRQRSDSFSGPSGTSSHHASQAAYLRTLTSTAAERKRTVAACRALRAQISRFEEAFMQLHGRPPKGAAERAPLATTYAQYREWKRAIRADAACRIQALFRGARTRWRLLRSGDPRMASIVVRKAGRPGFGVLMSTGPGRTMPSGPNSLLSKISIPLEFAGSDSDDLSSPLYAGRQDPGSAGRATGISQGGFDTGHGGIIRDGVEGGMEVVLPERPQEKAPSLSPNWSSSPGLSVPKRRSGRVGEDSGRELFSNPSVPSVPSSSSTKSVSTWGSAKSNLFFGGVHINDLTLPELQTRKRELKQQLKQYDMNFARQHGRMPVKAEKEPIRHLYESYNALKARISALEREGSGMVQGSPMQPSGAPVPYRRSTAVTNSSNASNASDNSSASGEEPANEAAAAYKANKRKEKMHPGSGRGYGDPSSGPTVPGSGSAGSSVGMVTPSGAPPNDLAALKAEKQQLHQMLRSYEKDFFRLHNRQVSSFADIRPVASQYRRYKEIKKAIAALQQQGGG